MDDFKFWSDSSLTTELDAIEQLKTILIPGFLCKFYSDLSILADN